MQLITIVLLKTFQIQVVTNNFYPENHTRNKYN